MIQKTENLSNDHPIIKIPQPVFLELFACCYAGHEIAIQNNAQQAFIMSIMKQRRLGILEFKLGMKQQL